jgi:hypothetical protein
MELAITITHTMTFGELIVGVGTGLLALLTGYLGFMTRQSAKAAQEAVEASEEPFVIATPTDSLGAMKPREHEKAAIAQGVLPPKEISLIKNDDGTHFVRVKLWNIGSGPAIVREVALLYGRERFLDGLPHFQPVGAGQAADIEIGSSAWPLSSRAATLTIDYVRASGLGYRTSQEVVVDGPLVLTQTYERSRL